MKAKMYREHIFADHAKTAAGMDEIWNIPVDSLQCGSPQCVASMDTWT